MDIPPRVKRIRDEILAQKNSICLERPLLIRKFRRTEGEPYKKADSQQRRAAMLAFILRYRKPVIYDDELIAGNMSSRRIAANYYPEGGTVNILEDIFRLRKKQIPLYLSFREKLLLLYIGLAELKSSIAARALLRPGRMKYFLDFFRAKRYFVTEEAGISHQVADYNLVVHSGLSAPYGRALDVIESGIMPDGSAAGEEELAFYKSAVLVIEGLRDMALNLADKAIELASSADVSEKRKQELSDIADSCRHVPFNPSRSFREGLQACWLVHIGMNMEDYEQGLSFGRLDRILYPLYKKDVESGRISREEALEIMASFQLKTCETIPVYSERVDKFFSGSGVAQGITLGGVDENGRDVTNALSSLILDAYSMLRTREPALHVRVHENTPADFLARAVETVLLGCGKPSFFGDRQIINALEKTGMTREHARDYAIIGCVEIGSQGRTYNSSDAALFNLPLCLELALNEGRRFNSVKGIGAATPPADKMKSFEDVLEAFRQQVDDAAGEMSRVLSWLEESYRIHRTSPLNSALTQGCMDSGLDVTRGGAMYDYTSIQVAGLADTGDSLYALKRLIFDEKRFTLADFVSILKRDFKKHEMLALELRNKFPRYGNSHAGADAMTRLAADVYSSEIGRRTNTRGGKYISGIYSMTCHYGFGKITGALPDGRRAGQRLSNGLSPVDGADVSGPTSMLLSAASLNSSAWANCCALNLKFDKKAVEGRAGLAAVSAMLNTYFRVGGMQAQINVLDTETLLAAQRDPASYPGIVVRVAGYCAYFNELQPGVQDEIIERRAHGL